MIWKWIWFKKSGYYFRYTGWIQFFCNATNFEKEFVRNIWAIRRKKRCNSGSLKSDLHLLKLNLTRIWKYKYRIGRWFLLLRFLTSAQRKEVRQFSDYQKYFVSSLIMIILRVKNPLKIIKSLRSARLALSKITIAPTNFSGIYELILNILELE